MSKLFSLIFTDDKSGFIGIGKVASGVLFPNGKVVVCWNGNKMFPSSVVVWDSMDQFKSISYSHSTSHIEWD